MNNVAHMELMAFKVIALVSIIPKARLLKIICFFCFMTPLGIVIGSVLG